MTFAFRRRSHRRLPAIHSRGRSPKMGWRSGFPTGRPWDFASIARLHLTQPCGQVKRIRTTSRTLSLGSHALRGHSWPTCGTLGPTHRLSEDSLLAGRCITCGDLNPICLPDPFGSISSGWPDRWPPTSALPAFHCFAGPSLQRSRSHLREPFSSFAVHFRVRRRREIYEPSAQSPKISDMR